MQNFHVPPQDGVTISALMGLDTRLLARSLRKGQRDLPVLSPQRSWHRQNSRACKGSPYGIRHCTDEPIFTNLS